MAGVKDRSGFPICYRGQKYPNIASLHRAWPGDKPSLATLNHKIMRWKKRNAGKVIGDSVVEVLMTTRKGVHAISHRGEAYSGPRALHAAAPRPKVRWGAFWARLDRFRSENPKLALTDEIINQLLAPEQFYDYRGGKYRSLPALYAAITEREISLGMFMIKLRQWRNEHPGKTPRDHDIDRCALATDRPLWIEYQGQRFDGVKALYDAQPGPKCSYRLFATRYRKLPGMDGVSPATLTRLLDQQWRRLPFFHGYLYQVTHRASGRAYIGITAQVVKERWRMHVRQAAEAGTYRATSLQAAIAQDGDDAFDVAVIAEFDDLEALLQAEREAIARHGTLTPRGYNLNIGGFGWSSRGEPVEYEGVLYPSWSTLAKTFGITEKLLDGRRRWRWLLADALTIPPGGRNRSNISIAVEGQRFDTIRAAADHFVAPYKLACARLKDGWTPAQALGLEPRNVATRKPVKIQGRRFPTIAEAARFYGHRPRKVYWQMARGKTVEETLQINDRN